MFSLGAWTRRIHTGFHVSRATWDAPRAARDFGYGAFTRSGAPFQALLLSFPVPCRGPATPADKSAGLGSSPFARRYLGNHCCLLFLRVLRCFTSPGWLPAPIWFRTGWRGIAPAGFSHSEISGSKRVCRSPKLIAACRVLRRLPMPRHPSRALSSLAKIVDFDPHE